MTTNKINVDGLLNKHINRPVGDEGLVTSYKLSVAALICRQVRRAAVSRLCIGILVALPARPVILVWPGGFAVEGLPLLSVGQDDIKPSYVDAQFLEIPHYLRQRLLYFGPCLRLVHLQDAGDLAVLLPELYENRAELRRIEANGNLLVGPS